MNSQADWLHAVRNEANAIGAALAVIHRSLLKSDSGTAQRFVGHGIEAMDRLRRLLADEPPRQDAAHPSAPADERS